VKTLKHGQSWGRWRIDLSCGWPPYLVHENEYDIDLEGLHYPGSRDNRHTPEWWAFHVGRKNWCTPEDEANALIALTEILPIVKPSGLVVPKPSGVVYFITDGEFIKIGFSSKGADERMRSLATGSPRELTLLMVVPGSRRVEKYFHQLFGQAHERGEWFRKTERLMDYINKIDLTEGKKLFGDEPSHEDGADEDEEG
jgi:hypothetical protein